MRDFVGVFGFRNKNNFENKQKLFGWWWERLEI
jgi:hypothetical protein